MDIRVRYQFIRLNLNKNEPRLLGTIILKSFWTSKEQSSAASRRSVFKKKKHIFSLSTLRIGDLDEQCREPRISDGD